MLPKFKVYFYPFLSFLLDGKSYKIADIRNYIADFYHLTQFDIEEKTKGGQNKHASYTNWAMTYLKKMGLIQCCIKGMYEITPLGKSLVEKYGEKLDLTILRDLKEYKTFQMNNISTSKNWVEGHYKADGTYVAGYLSNFVAQGLRKKK